MTDALPEWVADLVASGCDWLPLIAAKQRLGEKLTWKGTPTGKPMAARYTCWSLDGGRTHATEDEVRTAARRAEGRQ